MKSKHPYGAMATWCFGFLLLLPSLQAQVAAPRHVGVPQDWSDRSIVFTLDGLARHPNLVAREPRIAHQLMQRFNRSAGATFFRATGLEANSTAAASHHRDWNVSYVRGRVAADMYPAKYTFDPGASPDCQNDFVVFGLNVVGTTTKQANLIAFNNLYSGPGGICGAAPTVMWAYNVSTVAGGKVNLSPVISLDGTEIAFIESGTKTTIFHVLTWTAGQGSITNAAAPTMTSLTLSTTATSTTSAPWIDYSSNTAYAGVDGGQLYKITGAFTATPAIAVGWPVTVSNGHHLSPPVLDNRLNVLMVGSANGNLYQVDANTGSPTVIPVGAVGGTTPGVAAPPIVDVTNGTTFVVSANDGTSAVLVEVDTATLAVKAKARIGLGSSTGTPVTIPQPALDNNYYNDPSTGVIRLCGTGAADATPWQYSFGFTGATMNTAPVFSQQLVNAAAICSPWTEFFNLNMGTDFFFFGLNQNCVGASGCVIARTDNDSDPIVTASVPGGPSGIVIDNYSTAVQASSIYLSAEGASTAYKFTQNGLQ